MSEENSRKSNENNSAVENVEKSKTFNKYNRRTNRNSENLQTNESKQSIINKQTYVGNSASSANLLNSFRRAFNSMNLEGSKEEFSDYEHRKIKSFYNDFDRFYTKIVCRKKSEISKNNEVENLFKQFKNRPRVEEKRRKILIEADYEIKKLNFQFKKEEPRKTKLIKQPVTRVETNVNKDDKRTVIGTGQMYKANDLTEVAVSMMLNSARQIGNYVNL